MDFVAIIQNILNGSAIGAVYAIFALGYTLVFSILGVVNFAHAAVFTLGAYFTYFFLGQENTATGALFGLKLPFSLPFPLAMILGALCAAGVSALLERWAFRPLRRRNADVLLALVSSLGLALVIVNVLQYVVGTESLSFPINIYGDWVAEHPTLSVGSGDHPVQIRTVQVIIFAVSIVILLILAYLIGRTKVGKALRAVAENPTTASLLGINTDRFILFTFFLSGFLGGLAGTLVATGFGISGPYFGVAYGLKGLAVIVLGGLGSIPGAVLGGVVLGLVEAFVPSSLSAYKDAAAFALLFIVLILRPQGLLGRQLAQKV